MVSPKLSRASPRIEPAYSSLPGRHSHKYACSGAAAGAVDSSGLPGATRSRDFDRGEASRARLDLARPVNGGDDVDGRPESRSLLVLSEHGVAQSFL